MLKRTEKKILSFWLLTWVGMSIGVSIGVDPIAAQPLAKAKQVEEIVLPKIVLTPQMETKPVAKPFQSAEAGQNENFCSSTPASVVALLILKSASEKVASHKIELQQGNRYRVSVLAERSSELLSGVLRVLTQTRVIEVAIDEFYSQSAELASFVAREDEKYAIVCAKNIRGFANPLSILITKNELRNGRRAPRYVDNSNKN